jgi:hypothetical protein
MKIEGSRRPRRALEATAYHEAGHVVAAFFFNVPFRKKGATIIPDGVAFGGVHTKNIFRDKPDVNDSDAVRLRCERKAMVSLAGIIAQRKFNNRSVRHGHGSADRETAIDLMSYFFAPPVLEANLKFLIVQVESLFEHHPYAWQLVEAVAAALLEKKQLSGAELRQIILNEIQAQMALRHQRAAAS